ncbi:MAG: hypothetical protein AAGH15_18620 [Myxococcota bacterium]
MGRPSLRVLVALALAACSDEAPEAPPSPAADPAPPSPEPIAPPPAPEPPSLAPDEEARFGRVTLHPGFTPDPRTLGGDAGGPLDASTLAEGCAGFVAPAPAHVVDADGSFAELRFLVRPEDDDAVGLVLRDPGGVFHCVVPPEAGEGTVLAMPIAPGRHALWVSARSAALRPAYVLGISELTATELASLAR